MNTYPESCAIGAYGAHVVCRFLGARAHEGRYVVTDKGRLSADLQKQFGDVLMNVRRGTAIEVFGVEIKTERKHTGNLFLETWSNKARSTRGWMTVQRADILAYYFLDLRRLYLLSLPRLQAWAWGTHTGISGIRPYPERRARADQLNDTWGCCVPVCTLARVVGVQVHDLSDYDDTVELA